MIQESHTRIVPVTDDDVPTIIGILRDEGMNYGSVELYRDYFYKVLVDGDVAACLAILPRRGFMEVKSLVVRREHRSFSIFTRISEFSAYKALEHKTPCVVVKVSKHNPATMLYRRRRFVPMCPDTYPDIYRQLRADCIACHRVVQSVCNPIYMIIDTRLVDDTFEEWRDKVEAFI